MHNMQKFWFPCVKVGLQHQVLHQLISVLQAAAVCACMRACVPACTCKVTKTPALKGRKHTHIQSVLVIFHSYSFKSDRNQNKHVLFNMELKLICFQSNIRTLWVIKVLPAEPRMQRPFGVKSSSLAGSAFGSRQERLGSLRVSWLIMSSLIIE